MVSIFSILGFLYSYFYYDNFGINYLNHAEITDLFGVLFVHPVFFISLLFYLSALFVFTLFAEISKKSKFKNTKWTLGAFQRNAFKVACLIILIILASRPIWIITSKIREIKSSLLPIHQISYGKDNVIKCAVSIGSTSTSLFYWDIKLLESVIIPKKQVVKISVIMPEPPVKPRGSPSKTVSKGSADKKEYEKSLILWGELIKEKCN